MDGTFEAKLERFLEKRVVCKNLLETAKLCVHYDFKGKHWVWP